MYIYIYIEREREIQSELSPLRRVFKARSGQLAPGPGRFDFSQGIFEVNMSNGFEVSRIGILRSDRLELELELERKSNGAGAGAIRRPEPRARQARNPRWNRSPRPQTQTSSEVVSLIEFS